MKPHSATDVAIGVAYVVAAGQGFEDLRRWVRQFLAISYPDSTPEEWAGYEQAFLDDAKPIFARVAAAGGEWKVLLGDFIHAGAVHVVSRPDAEQADAAAESAGLMADFVEASFPDLSPEERTFRMTVCLTEVNRLIDKVQAAGGAVSGKIPPHTPEDVDAAVADILARPPAEQSDALRGGLTLKIARDLATRYPESTPEERLAWHESFYTDVLRRIDQIRWAGGAEGGRA
jgi:hypothetical protein